MKYYEEDGYKYHRGFYQLSRSWYGKSVLASKGEDFVDDIMLGLYSDDGGTIGEFCIEWGVLGDWITPRLHAYDDSWKVLYEFRDVLEKLAKYDNENISVKTVIEILLECGFKDETQEEYKDD